MWAASPIELTCEPLARSVEELERLFADPSGADLRLLSEVALLARDKGIDRPKHQVFAIAPHPAFTGSITAGKLVPMDLTTWHHLASQIRISPQAQTGAQSLS